MTRNNVICSFILFLLVTFGQGLQAQENAYAEDQLVLTFHMDKWVEFLNSGSRNLDAFDAVRDLNHRYRLLEWRAVGITTFRSEDRELLYATPLPIQLVFDDLGEDLHNAREAYEETGLFRHVEYNYKVYAAGILDAEVIPNDPHLDRQWALENDGSFTLSTSVVDADIDMFEAWGITTGSDEVVMAVMDTGTKLDHPEYAGRVWVNEEEVINGLDDDDNGFVDDINGYDFVNRDPDPTDDDSHGTAVSGVIVATGDNGIGYAGVDWHCRIMTCKVLNNEGSGENIPIAEAIFYAANNGAHVMNLSLGTQSFNAFVETAVNFANLRGVVMVAAMGNAGIETNHYPAALGPVIAVGSTDPDDKRSKAFVGNPNFGSNFGNYIDLVAPGNFIYSLAHNSNTNYNRYYGGTSLSTPYVAGVCGLLKAQDMSRSPDEIRMILQETSEDQVGDSEDKAGWDKYYGHGRLNAFHALSYDMTPVRDPDIGQTRIYPNPVRAGQSLIRIESEYAIDWSGGTARLFDAGGRYLGILNQEYDQKSIILTLPPSLPPGKYTLRWSDGKHTHSKKFLVH